MYITGARCAVTRSETIDPMVEKAMESGEYGLSTDTTLNGTLGMYMDMVKIALLGGAVTKRCVKDGERGDHLPPSGSGERKSHKTKSEKVYLLDLGELK